MLTVYPIKTNIYNKETKLVDFLINETNNYCLEGKILAITSKIVSLSENCLISKKSIEKNELIKKEADVYIGRTLYDIHLTIKNNLLIPSAGIDESNLNEEAYLLYPKAPFASAQHLHQRLKKRLGLKKFGVILTDSKTSPLKKGVTGTCLAYYGFEALDSKVGQPDLFGNELQFTYINQAEALATSATLLMGEASEQKPIALIDFPVNFKEFDCSEEQSIPIDEDIYGPLLKPFLTKS